MSSRKAESARPILSEEGFHGMLSLERRRTERSHKPFLLMLVETKERSNGANGHRNLNAVSSLLAQSARETDIIGWYKDEFVVGVIFTELEPDKKKDIVDMLLTRINRALSENLTREQYSQLRISFHWFPEKWQDVLRVRPDTRLLYPELVHRDRARSPKIVVKRLVDILGSLAALIIASPIFVLVALAIKLTSKGPILYKQQRVGQNGHPFMLLKFRSMHSNNDNSAHKEYVAQFIAGAAPKKPCNGNGHSVYKLTSDPRITPVGAFLRKSSLDEFPQFINVLKGEMSLVGPRPPLEYEIEKYQLWHRRRVMEAKPGITGLWQVSGRNRLPFDEMVRLDLMYAKEWSPWLDLKILLRTPKAVIAGAN